MPISHKEFSKLKKKKTARGFLLKTKNSSDVIVNAIHSVLGKKKRREPNLKSNASELKGSKNFFNKLDFKISMLLKLISEKFSIKVFCHVKNIFTLTLNFPSIPSKTVSLV